MLLKPFLGAGLTRAAGIYMIANVATASVPFLLLPILTRHLSTTEYGLVAMFLVLVGIVSPLVGVNVHGAVQRRYYDDSVDALPAYVGNCLLILFGSATLVGLVLIPASGVVYAYTSFPVAWMWAVLVVSVCQFVVQIRLVIWQAETKPVRYGVFHLCKTILYFGLSISLVVGLGLGWQGVVLGSVGASVLGGVAALYLLRADGWVRLQFDRAHIRNALYFGIPLVPHALGGFAITATDRLFITNLIGLGEAGVYMVAVQISMILMLLFTSFNRAYTPWLFERLKRCDPETDRQIVRLTYMYLPIALLMAIGLGGVAPSFIGFYVGEQFARAHLFVSWLAVGAAFHGMYLMVTNYVFFAEKTKLLFLGTFGAALINVLLTYFLITRFGAVGAAQATAVTYFCKFAFTWWLSARVHPMPWRIRWQMRTRLT